MAVSLNQLATVAEYELASKGRTVSDVFGILNSSGNEMKVDLNTWSSNKNSTAPTQDEAMDTSPPENEIKNRKSSPKQSSSNKAAQKKADKNAASSKTKTSTELVIPPAPRSTSSEGETASQTPSSAGTSPPLPMEVVQPEKRKETVPRPRGSNRRKNGANSGKNTGIKVEVQYGVIVTNACFKSFLEFETAFDLWKQTYHHPFRVASSETLRNPDGSINALFKYKYIVFHCAHYGRPRMRGAGKRPNQNYLPCGCKAMLRLNYAYGNGLRITTLHEKHFGHDLSADSYAKIASKIRRISPGNKKSPVIRRPQAQHPLRNKREGKEKSEETPAQIKKPDSPCPVIQVATSPVSIESPLTMMAKNVAQIGLKQEVINGCQQNFTGLQQVAHFNNGIQNLAAVAAAINHHQQQQAAVAFFAQQKENMSYGYQASNLLPQAQMASANPQLLPLLRGFLGLPNFGSSFLLPTQSQLPISEITQSGSITDGHCTSTSSPTLAVASIKDSIVNVQNFTQRASTFANFFNLQQQQQLQQQQNLAVALNLAQQFRVPHLNAPAPLQIVVSQTAQQAASMSAQAAIPTSLANTPIAQAATPIDLSSAASTPNSETFEEAVTHSLLPYLKQCEGEDKRNKLSGLMQLFPGWKPPEFC